MKQLKDCNPTVIARETLKQLALLKIPPTPENYHKLYSQIEGGGIDEASSMTATAQPFTTSADDHAEVEAANWGETIEMLLSQLENRHAALTMVKKREGVHRVLAKFSKDPEQLHTKLNALINSWRTATALSRTLVEDKSDENTSVTQTASEHFDSIAGLQDMAVEQWPDLLIRLLENFVIKQLNDPSLREEAKSLARRIRESGSKQQMEMLAGDFHRLCTKFEAYGENNLFLQQGLLNLLNTLLDNTGELLTEDQWIRNQMRKLRETIAKPLDFQVIEQAEHYLEEISQRQEVVKRNLNEAKLTLKQMVTTLITNIEDLSDTTGEYHVKLEQYADQIRKTDDINILNRLLVSIMDETKLMQKNTQNYRNDFLTAQAEVTRAQHQINQLEFELQQMGEKAHEDHLTGVLNRRGLDSAFEREAVRTMRYQTSLCFAVLDIDNFKQLNDTHGHKVGDDALVYLVESVKDTTRPEDVISRYGGEEFVILLPNTSIEEAVQVLSRIRRNLTKKFFLNENKRILITFSAGVAQLMPGESQESVFKRADEALYRAKKGGKNQVVKAELVKAFC